MNMMERKQAGSARVDLRPRWCSDRGSTTSSLCSSDRSRPGSPSCRALRGMGFDWVYVNPFHETGASGSLYAVKDPFRLDPRFRDGGEDDDAQIRRFVAGGGGARPHGDDGSRRSITRPGTRTSRGSGRSCSSATRPASCGAPIAIDPDDPTKRTVWSDLAELDYDTAPARRGAHGILGPLHRRMSGPRRQGFPLRRRLQGSAGRLARPHRRRQGAGSRSASSPPRPSAAPWTRPRRPPRPASTTFSTASRGGTSRRRGRSSSTRRCATSRRRSRSPRTTTWPGWPRTRRGRGADRPGPQGPLCPRGVLLDRRADADRLRVGLSPPAPRGGNHPARPGDDRHRHLGLHRGDQPAAHGARRRANREGAQWSLASPDSPGRRPPALRCRASRLGRARPPSCWRTGPRCRSRSNPASSSPGAAACSTPSGDVTPGAAPLEFRARIDGPSRPRRGPHPRGAPRGAGAKARGRARQPERRRPRDHRGRAAADRRGPVGRQARRRGPRGGLGRHLHGRPRQVRRRRSSIAPRARPNGAGRRCISSTTTAGRGVSRSSGTPATSTRSRAGATRSPPG